MEFSLLLPVELGTGIEDRSIERVESGRATRVACEVGWVDSNDSNGS